MLAKDLEYRYGRGIESQHHSRPCSICRLTDYRFRNFPHFHGTDFGRCSRAVQVDSYRPAPIPSTLQEKQFFSDGHLHERAIVETLRLGGLSITNREDSKAGIPTSEFITYLNINTGIPKITIVTKDEETLKSIISQRPELDEIVIVGHVDGIIEDKYLIEIKAVSDWSFHNKFHPKYLPKSYLAQMQIYMHCRRLIKGFLIVKNRNDSEIAWFQIERTAEDEADIIKKAKEFRRIVDLQGTDIKIPCQPMYQGEKKFCKACQSK